MKRDRKPLSFPDPYEILQASMLARARASDKYSVPAVVYRSNPSSKFHTAGKLDGASKGRTARYNLHSNSRASRTMMTDRREGRGGRQSLRPQGWTLLSQRAISRRARRITLGRCDSIETHSDMLIRSENCETTIPAPAPPSHTPPWRPKLLVQLSSRVELRNYPPAKYAVLSETRMRARHAGPFKQRKKRERGKKTKRDERPRTRNRNGGKSSTASSSCVVVDTFPVNNKTFARPGATRALRVLFFLPLAGRPNNDALSKPSILADERA